MKTKRAVVKSFTCAVCGKTCKLADASSCYVENRCIACHRAKCAKIDRAYAARKAA